MNAKEKQFRAELVDLCKKHGVRIGSNDRYNNDECYTGEDFHFWSAEIDRLTLDELKLEVNEGH